MVRRLSSALRQPKGVHMAFYRTALAIAGAAVAFGSAHGVSAADLGGSVKDQPYAYAAPSGPAGWYITGYGAWASYDVDGISIVDQALTGLPVTDFTSPTSGIDNGWSVGGGIGKYLGRGFRGDLTLEYRTSTDVSGTVGAPCCTEISTATEFDGVVGLANLYYDFNRGGRFVPYIGAGIGFAHLETKAGTVACTVGCAGGFGDADYAGSSTTNFAVAAMAGLSWRLHGGGTSYMSSGGMKDEPVEVSNGRALYLDVGYRFLYLGDVDGGTAVQTSGNELKVEWDDLRAHEVRVGLRYDLN